jgi:hypothetical protein
VWAFAVEFAHEGIEARLLLQAVHARRAGGLLFQGQVHALVTTVLLRVSGLDALDADAEPQPPTDSLERRDAQVSIQAADQQFANLARAPMRLVPLQSDDQALNLGRQLIGIPHGPTAAVTQRFGTVLPVAREDLVAGLARDAELPANVCHRLAVEQRGRALRRLRAQASNCEALGSALSYSTSMRRSVSTK